jgi:hypothetical protein
MSENIEEKFKEVKEYLWETWQTSERYKDFVVELDTYDIQTAKEIGMRRYEESRTAKSKNPRLSKKQSIPFERDILGALGEMAAIKWLKQNGYCPSIDAFISTEVRGQKDTFDTDFVFDGEKVTVEIKTTEKPLKAKLIYPYHKGLREDQPDVFILVSQIDESRYCIKGFTDQHKVLNSLDETLPKKAYAVPENKLSNDLKKVIKTNIINKK